MNKNTIPILSENKSLMPPIRICTIAPPAIPVMSMPANDPWCFETELSPKETIIGYITDKKNPEIGKVVLLGPKMLS